MSNHRSDAFVLFGATGDLAGRKIYPALQALVRSGQLDAPVIGVALSGWALDILRQHICNSLELHSEVDAQAYAKYPTLTEPEIRTLVVDEKWLAALDAAFHSELARVSHQLTQRVEELTERYATLRYIRGAVWFVILMAQPVTEAIAPIMSRSFQSPTATQATQRINLTLTIFLGILAFVSLPWFKQYWPVLPEKAGLISYDTPVEATQYLIDHRLPGKVFHNMAYGSYLIWAAQPDYKVFVDSRIELYPNEIWMDYLAITNAQNGWEDLLEKYQVSTLILGIKDQSPLVLAVELSDDWKEFYSDQTVIIFSGR